MSMTVTAIVVSLGAKVALGVVPLPLLLASFSRLYPIAAAQTVASFTAFLPSRFTDSLFRPPITA